MSPSTTLFESILLHDMTELPSRLRRAPSSRCRTPVPLGEDDVNEKSIGTVHTPPPCRLKKLNAYFLSKTPSDDAPNSDSSASEPIDAGPSDRSRAHSLLQFHDYRHQTERSMDMLAATLLTEPGRDIASKHIGTLFSVFEVYRQLRAENTALLDRLEAQSHAHAAVATGHTLAEQHWLAERLTYKAEVKRLELVIMSGKRGLADVARARQGSFIRRGGQTSSSDEAESTETVFEFLNSLKNNDKRLDDMAAQRAVFRPKPSYQTFNNSAQSQTSLSSAPRMLRKTSSILSLGRSTYGTAPPVFVVGDQRHHNGPSDHVPTVGHRPLVRSFFDDSSSVFSGATGDLLPGDENVASPVPPDDMIVSGPKILSRTAERRRLNGLLLPLDTNVQQSNQASSVLWSPRTTKTSSDSDSLIKYRVASCTINGLLIHAPSPSSGHSRAPTISSTEYIEGNDTKQELSTDSIMISDGPHDRHQRDRQRQSDLDNLESSPPAPTTTPDPSTPSFSAIKSRRARDLMTRIHTLQKGATIQGTGARMPTCPRASSVLTSDVNSRSETRSDHGLTQVSGPARQDTETMTSYTYSRQPCNDICGGTPSPSPTASHSPTSTNMSMIPSPTYHNAHGRPRPRPHRGACFNSGVSAPVTIPGCRVRSSHDTLQDPEEPVAGAGQDMAGQDDLPGAFPADVQCRVHAHTHARSHGLHTTDRRADGAEGVYLS